MGEIMKNWLKKKLGIVILEEENKRLKDSVNEYRAAVARNERFVSEKIAELKEYTRVDADIGFRGNNTIILTGVYRKKAFVRFYDIGDGEFVSLVEQLRSMKNHALIRHVDTPPQFFGTFEI